MIVQNDVVGEDYFAYPSQHGNANRVGNGLPAGAVEHTVRILPMD